MNLRDAFITLAVNQQDFIVKRASCDKDTLACEGVGISVSLLTKWKQDESFRQVYDAVVSTPSEIIGELIIAIETVNALEAVKQKRDLLRTPWSELTARDSTAKSQMITDSLERIVPKRVKKEEPEASMLEILKRVQGA